MSNLFDALKSNHTDDCNKIRQAFPFLNRFSDIEVDNIWRRYSDSRGAGWLIVSDGALNDFFNWIQE